LSIDLEADLSWLKNENGSGNGKLSAGFVYYLIYLQYPLAICAFVRCSAVEWPLQSILMSQQ